MAASPTGIELSAKYFILSFLIVIFPLLVNIDGQETKGKWGTQFYPLSPGNHSVTVSWKFYWLVPIQKATMNVSLAEGQVDRVQYYVPWLIFLPGKIGPAPA
jgi:hypothetical protein